MLPAVKGSTTATDWSSLPVHISAAVEQDCRFGEHSIYGTRFAIVVALFAIVVALSGVRPVNACPCDSVKVPSSQPADINMQAGLEFTHTAQYHKEFATATKAAEDFCRKFKAQHPEKRNIAVVADIDETIFDNREEYEIRPKFVWDEFDKWVAQARAPVLKDTVNFLRWARKNGFAVFLITGRPESDRVGTVENLVRDQIVYDGLYLRPDNDEGPVQIFKTSVRKSIEDAGFTVVGNIGDQFSDLAGGHSLDCEKLPNRMYFIQ